MISTYMLSYNCIKNYPSYGAFWANEELIYYISNDTHIGNILKNPEMFNVYSDSIKKLYKKYNEPFGSEGQARDELIKKVMNDGWVRIRHYSNPRDYWSIQFDRWNLRKNSIANFILWGLMESNVIKNHDELIFMGFKDGYDQQYPYNAGGVSQFLMEYYDEQ